MNRSIYVLFFAFLVLFLSGCNGGNAAPEEGDYDKTKKMVVDILQTEDGKKALQEMLADEKMKQELVIQSDVVKKSINETLVSDKGKEMWEMLFKDPKFVEGYAKSMEKEQEKLLKKMMNDADYQKQMLELLKDPKMTEQLLTVLKSQEFRAHLEETIQQTLETPVFQAKIQEILLKAAEKQAQEKGGNGGGKSQQGGGESGGGGPDKQESS